MSFRGGGSTSSGQHQTEPEEARSETRNGQPAIGWYIQWQPGEDYRAAALGGDRVRDIVAFASPELFEAFGLPPELPAGTG